MGTRWCLQPCIALVALVGCVTGPPGPSVMVFPSPGKPFEQFQAEEAVCRQWARAEVGSTPGQASTQAALSTAVIWTIIGAALGAALGGASGDAGIGAAIGAGSGALQGTLAGVSASQAAAGTVQWRYDAAYQQCMYAKGNQIPGNGIPQPWYAAPPSPPPPGPSSELAPPPPPAPPPQ